MSNAAIDSTAKDWREKQRRLDECAAPFFSGLAFVAGVIFVGFDHWPTAIFFLASAFGYCSRMIYLYWKEING